MFKIIGLILYCCYNTALHAEKKATLDLPTDAKQQNSWEPMNIQESLHPIAEPLTQIEKPWAHRTAPQMSSRPLPKINRWQNNKPIKKSPPKAL